MAVPAIVLVGGVLFGLGADLWANTSSDSDSEDKESCMERVAEKDSGNGSGRWKQLYDEVEAIDSSAELTLGVLCGNSYDESLMNMIHGGDII